MSEPSSMSLLHRAASWLTDARTLLLALGAVVVAAGSVWALKADRRDVAELKQDVAPLQQALHGTGERPGLIRRMESVEEATREIVPMRQAVHGLDKRTAVNEALLEEIRRATSEARAAREQTQEIARSVGARRVPAPRLKPAVSPEKEAHP